MGTRERTTHHGAREARRRNAVKLFILPERIELEFIGFIGPPGGGADRVPAEDVDGFLALVEQLRGTARAGMPSGAPRIAAPASPDARSAVPALRAPRARAGRSRKEGPSSGHPSSPPRSPFPARGLAPAR